MTNYSTSRQKISQLNDQLDRQLEKVSNNRVPPPKREREDFRFVPKHEELKKQAYVHKPVVYDHNFREAERSKKNQLSQLERKLQELERKMDNLSVSSEEEDQPVHAIKNHLNFKDKNEISTLNEDTARFLVSASSEKQQKQRQRRQHRLPYPTLQNEQDEEEEEDSEDYFQIQKAIQLRKREQIQRNNKISSKIHHVQTKRQTNSNQNKHQKGENTDRKAQIQTQNILRPKYSNQKLNNNNNKSIKQRVASNHKKSIRDSIVSKKSVQKGQKKLQRTNSKRSFQGGNKSLRKSRQNGSRDKQLDNRSQKNEQSNLHSEQMQMIKDIKRMGNLQKQLVHYKRLVKKYKEQIEGYRVMQIEFKEMKKNFGKSQLIRGQQKKIIENLKHRIGSK